MPDIVIVCNHFIDGPPDPITLCRAIRSYAGLDVPILYISAEQRHEFADSIPIEWFDIVGDIERVFFRVHALSPLGDIPGIT